MIKTKFEVQLLIGGDNLSETEIAEYIYTNIRGTELLAVGDESLIRIHFHTDEPWQVLEYCASVGDIHDIDIDNTERKAKSLQPKFRR